MLALKQLVRTTLPPAISPKPRDSGRDAPDVPRSNPLWQSLALKRAGIQPKLNVSQPADPQEREADRIADRVMRMPAPSSGDRELPFSSTPSPKAERKCAPCDEQEDKLQLSMQGDSASVSAVPSIVNEGLDSPGYPLEPRTQEFMEGRFGQDFNQVRVHVNEESSTAAQAVHAKAFTVGRDVVFGRGEYAPHTTSGLKLLAHELAHFGQSQTAATAPREVIQRQAIEDDKDYDVVKFGDRGEANLFRLSIAYGVSFSEIKRLNAHLEKDNWTVRKGDLIKLPQGTLVKLKQSELTHGAGTAISSDSIPSEQRPDTSITSRAIPPDTSKTTAPKQTVVHQPTVTRQKPPTTQTVATVSASTRALAHSLLHKYASFLPGTEYYVPFSLDEEGLGKELAKNYSKQSTVVLAVLDLTQWADRDEVTYEFVNRIEDVDLLRFSPDDLKRLQKEMTGMWQADEETDQIGRIAHMRRAKASARAARKTSASLPAKVDANRPARPSNPATQMANLLAAAKTSEKPAHYCYRAIKKAILKAGGYGDLLNMYKDKRFADYGAAAIDFAAAVTAHGAANLGLKVVRGSPVDAVAGTLLVIKGNGKQRISQEYGDISVIEGKQGGLLICYNDGRMKLPGDAATWESGRYAGIVLGMYQPIARS